MISNDNISSTLANNNNNSNNSYNSSPSKQTQTNSSTTATQKVETSSSSVNIPGSASESMDKDKTRLKYTEKLRSQISKDSIKTMFDFINENKVQSWETKLLESKHPSRDFSLVNDAEILNEKYFERRLLRLLKGDIERTRVQESLYFPTFKDYCIQFLGYYLEQTGISYKQGLNEICGVFILLKFKIQISFSRLYKMFVCFIDKFLTNYFAETEFYAFRSSLSLISLLLKYYDPQLFYLFEYSMVKPELYATSWMLTVFSNKSKLNMVYYLWDKLILFDDVLFIHFFIVALVIKNKDKILKTDYTTIPSVLSGMNLDDIEEVDEVLERAMDMRRKTPQSFDLLVEKLEIFKFGSKNLKEKFEFWRPMEMICMPIFVSELMFMGYKDLIG